MAADWIKVEDGLIDKPEVMQLSEILGIDQFSVVGHLVVFWCWVDRNLSPVCPQVPGTTKGLDRVAGRDGFTTALCEVGWLKIEDGLVSIPNYDLHLSNSAKTRAKEQRKKAQQRKVSRDVSPSCPQSQGTKQGTREEKRREEKSNNTLSHTDAVLESKPKDQPIIPDELAKPWADWTDHYLNIHGRMPNVTYITTEVYRLSQLGADKAARDIAFSISKSAKSILDSSDVFKYSNQRTSSPSKPNKMVGIND